MGKRRRAREMALQMMYQAELGDSSLPEVFAEFKPQDYLRESTAPSEEDEAEQEPPRKSQAREPAPSQPKVPRKTDRELENAFAYARQLVQGTRDHREQIDTIIRQHAENWRLERMPVIDRNVLRIAVYEMLHESGVPKVVILDEAIELAKRFGSENSGRFVNGLLDGVLRADRRPAETGT